uniref:hypothetical protein n=1 Tax=uncultured Draconibacterium sp. TaxID=1573823 RepID=UPI003217FA5A
MFTVGIFTTHIPYIAMVAFYAYFLIFGIHEATEGKVQVSEKSFIVQTHLNSDSEVINTSDCTCFYTAFAEEVLSAFYKKTKVKQRWKHFCVDRFLPQNQPDNTIFGRPPPVCA